MKKITIIIFTFLFMLLLVSCGSNAYPDLPDDACGFETGSFNYINDDNASYLTIEYNGRTYIPYGTIGKTLHSKDIDECIGYVIMDDKTDIDTRLFILVDDKEHNYLMMHYVATTLMNPPTFYRAVDTNGKTIKTPDYIESLEYLFWK